MRYSIHLLCWTALCAIALCGGCTTQVAPEQSMSDRQDQALKHPFDYSPGDDIPDISGGGIGNFDSKAFGKDLNHVLSP